MLTLIAFALSQEPPKFDGEVRTLELDAPGGIGGAPEGMAFIVPPGAQAETFAGDLGGGVQGLRITTKAPADAVACTQSLAMSGTVFVKARVRVPAVTPGAADWQGATVEVRARDANGGLVSPPGMMFTPVQVVRAPTDWEDVQGKITVPAGATKGEVCFRLVLSTGTMEVDRLMVIAPKAAGVSSAPALVAATPAPVSPTPAPVSPPAPVVAALAPSAVGSAGPHGLVLDAPSVSSGVSCSGWLPASKAITVFGTLTVSTQEPAAPDWSGIVVEAYAQGAGGPLIPFSGAPYLPLRARTMVGSETFSERWTPPKGAQQVKVCVRYASAAGTAAVDWRGGS
jgi:hypothetical protein